MIPHSPTRIKLRTLGESMIEVGSSQILPSATHLFSVLLYLCIERGRSVARIELAGLLFPEEPLPEAYHKLRQLVYRSRRLGAPIATTPSTLRLTQDAVEDDVTNLLSSSVAYDVGRSPDRLVVLPHYCPPTAPLSDWVEKYRDRVQPQLIRLFTKKLQSARTNADWSTVESLAKASLAIDPYNETATLSLAEAMARIGSKKQAVALLREFEVEVGRSSESLALPPRLLAKRITEGIPHPGSVPDTALYGRHSEIARLSGLWSRARSGHFVSLLVTGSESIGKSRLLGEFASLIRVDGSGAVVSSRRAPLDHHRPLSLFADACGQLMSMPGAAGCAPTSLQFLSRLTGPPTASQNHNEDAYDLAYHQSGVRHALADLLDSVLAERPLAWIVDDAEHIDDASLAMLREMQTRLACRPCFLLLCSRHPDTAGILDVPKLRLGPLNHEDGKRLAVAMNTCASHSLSDEAVDWSATLAAGNPGHLQLLLLHRAHAKNDLHAPLDLVAAIDHRIASVSGRSLHFLQACAIFGRRCTSDDVRALTGLSSYALMASLQELEDNALISNEGASLQCSSGLIEERVLASTSPAVRELLHRRSARRLERSIAVPSNSAALAWKIAEHWTKAGSAESALNWKERCWQQSISIGQPMAVVSSIRETLATASTPKERARLLTALAGALRAAGEFTTLLEVLEERFALTYHVGDDVSRKSALEFDLLEARNMERPDLQPFVASLLHHVRNANLDPIRRLRASRMLMVVADQNFDAAVGREAFAVHQSIGHLHSRSGLMGHHATLIYHAVFGDRHSALEHASRLEQASQQTERSWASMVSIITSTIARRIVDPGPQDYEALTRCFRESRALGMNRLASTTSALVTACLFDDGRFAEAREWGDAAQEAARELSAEEIPMEHLTSAIDLALFEGNMHGARQLIDRLTRSEHRFPAPRMQRELLVYRVRVDQFLGGYTSDRDLDSLLELHDRGSSFGRHDDHAEVLWVALMSRGATRQASAMLESYLKLSRREVRPCNYYLRTRTASDPVWLDPSISRLSLPGLLIASHSPH
jgi:DNA-binding SARP family transcriptional activator